MRGRLTKQAAGAQRVSAVWGGASLVLDIGEGHQRKDAELSCAEDPSSGAMGSGGRAGSRVLCIYGSESGNAKRGAEKLSKKLEGEGLTVVEVAEGNKYQTEADLTTLKEKCDVLVVVSSSFGEGDPPENFNLFLLQLYKASKNDTKPLAGMQHVVLGEKATIPHAHTGMFSR